MMQTSVASWKHTSQIVQTLFKVETVHEIEKRLLSFSLFYYFNIYIQHLLRKFIKQKKEDDQMILYIFN